MKEKKQEFVDWFYEQKPYWPTPPQCFDWIIENVAQFQPSYTKEQVIEEIGNAWEAGSTWTYRQMIDSETNMEPDKQSYINNLKL